MGFFSEMFPQSVSAASTEPGQGGGGGGLIGSMFPALLQRMVQEGKLPVPQAASAAPPVPAATTSSISPWILATLALDPSLHMAGGEDRWGGIMNPAFQAMSKAEYDENQRLRRMRDQAILAQNSAAAVPSGAPQLMAHRGGFVHQHPLPGESIRAMRFIKRRPR